MRLTDGGVWVVASDMAYPASSPLLMAATGDHPYLLTEDGVTMDRVGVWRYDSDLSWTRVADVEGQSAGLASTAVGGDDQVVFVVAFDPDPLNPTRSTIWAWSETDGLRQGVFETASGPEPVFEGGLGMRASVDYGGEFVVSTFGGGFMSSMDGLSWTFMAEPLGVATVAAVHDGLMVFSDYWWLEAGVQEEPIRTWDGTSTQVLADPGPDMAWTSFQSDGTNLWMVGFRDIDDYSQGPVEGGVYRSTNGIDRVSVTSGIPDLEGIVDEILLLEAAP